MSSFDTKNKKQLPMQGRIPVVNNTKLKRRQSDGSPPTRINSIRVNQKSGPSYETTSSLNLSHKQNGPMRPKTTTIPLKTNELKESSTEILPSLSNLIPPPVAPRTKLSLKTNVEKPPTPKERKSISKNNEKPETIVQPVNGSDKLVLPNINNSKETSEIQNDIQLTPHTPGLCGLNNIGNTCFMNSALQCLSNIPDLTQWAKDQKPCSSSQNKDIIHVYTSLIQSMWSGKNSSVNPRDVKQVVSRSASIFIDYGQKDSHEFMNTLLNIIERTNSSLIITNLFRIHTKSQVTCNSCEYVDTTDESTTFLPLPLSEKTSHNEEILLEKLIIDYCQEDNLDGLYYCHSCAKYTQAKQKTNICSPLSRVLIIQLKRFPFDNTYHKIDTLVRYKLQHQNLLSNNDRYELCAVSSHVGSLASGHYTTLARNNKTKKWYRFNDDRVHETDLNSVVTKNAYVLVYLKSEESDSSAL